MTSVLSESNQPALNPARGELLQPELVIASRYVAGGFAYMEHSEESPGIHDLENVGDTTIRYATVELL